MNKKMLTFEFLMIQSLLIMNMFPQESKWLAWIMLSAPLVYAYTSCLEDVT